MILDAIISFFLGVLSFLLSLIPSFPALDDLRDSISNISVYMTDLIETCCFIIPVSDLLAVGGIYFVIFGGLWAFKIIDFVIQKVRGSG